MKQIRRFLTEAVAYKLANTCLGYRISAFSDEMTRLRNTEVNIGALMNDEGDLRGGDSNIELAREWLAESKDSRYITNPFYNADKHKKAKVHTLFDDIKKPCKPNTGQGYALLRKGTLISASSIEFVLHANAKVEGTQDKADKVMAAQADRYKCSKKLIIPKGTRITLQGCPFYLSNDAEVGEWSEKSQALINQLVAEDAASIASTKAIPEKERFDGSAMRKSKSEV